jgi:hypothetical protein
MGRPSDLELASVAFAPASTPLVLGRNQNHQSPFAVSLRAVFEMTLQPSDAPMVCVAPAPIATRMDCG